MPRLLGISMNLFAEASSKQVPRLLGLSINIYQTPVWKRPENRCPGLWELAFPFIKHLCVEASSKQVPRLLGVSITLC